MEDTTPRLTPPPKPAVLELTTPKHAVPEVSLMCDSESSFTWQAMQHKHTSKTANQPHSNTKTVRFDSGGQEYNRNTARRPQPQQTQEFLYNFPRVAPSRPVGKGGGQASPLISPRLLPPQRVILAERGYKDVQHTASSPYSSHPIHPAKEYNPQMYSPVTQRNVKLTSEDQDGLQSDRLLGNQVISSRQRFSPAAAVPHTVGVPQGPLPTVPLVVRDVQQERSVESNGTPPPHSSNLQHSTGSDGSSSRLRPHILPPGTSTPHTNTYRPPYSPVSLTATTRTTTLPPPPTTTTSHNAFLASQSLPHLQQPQPPTHIQGHNHHPSLYGNRDWCSPASSSLPASSTSPYITQRPQYPVGEAWGHPEGHYSPVVPAARLPHSPADPVVYGLIEDQKQQILKLTLDLQKIMERQAKEEEDRRTPVTTNHQTRTIKRQDVTTQTQGPGQPAVQSIGVNTDISWPHLLASLTHQQEKEEEEEATHPKHSRVQGQEAWLRDIRGSQEPVPSHRHHSPQRDSSESASEVTQDGSQEDSESSSSQEWSEGRPPHLPSTNTGPTRFDAGDGWQEALGDRNHGTPPAPSPTPPPTGTTFYHNVMTNIQQILQQTNPTQQQQQLHQQQQQQLHQQQQQQQQPITPSSQGMVLRGNSEEGSTPDPQIEAVRQQLVNFGISFLDPATLAHTNRPLMDSLYLPGLHNAVSLYQSSISTHLHHPSDATAAKYLTDSQLAAIAAASPAMKKKSSGSTDQPGSAVPPSGLATHHQHHRLFFVNGEGENSNSVSITTKKFLEKYGLQED